MPLPVMRQSPDLSGEMSVDEDFGLGPRPVVLYYFAVLEAEQDPVAPRVDRAGRALGRNLVDRLEVLAPDHQSIVMRRSVNVLPSHCYRGHHRLVVSLVLAIRHESVRLTRN